MGAYDDKIKALFAGYRGDMLAHLVRMEKMMGTEEIPIYTRWQELKAVIRAFDALAEQSDKTNLLLDVIHKKN